MYFGFLNILFYAMGLLLSVNDCDLEVTCSGLPLIDDSNTNINIQIDKGASPYTIEIIFPNGTLVPGKIGNNEVNRKGNYAIHVQDISKSSAISLPEYGFSAAYKV